MEDIDHTVIKFIKRKYTSNGVSFETLFFHSSPPNNNKKLDGVIELKIDNNKFEFITPFPSEIEYFDLIPLLKAIEAGLKIRKEKIENTPFLKFQNEDEVAYEPSANYSFNSLNSGVRKFDENYKNFLSKKTNDNLTKIKEINSIQDELNYIYDGIDLSLKKNELKESFYSKPGNENKLKDFINSLFANLFMEPTIVKKIFSKKVLGSYDDSFSDQIMIKGKDISIKQERLETAILKNVAKVNAIINGEPEEVSQRTEGVFAYYQSALINLTTDKNLVLGWVPYAKHKNKIHCLSSRNVQFDYKFLNKLDVAVDEDGWIHPDAMNESIESTRKNRKLVDNQLLFQYIGESLGYESIIRQVEKKKEQEETLVEDFIKEFIYTKTIKVAKETKQIPLLDKEEYSYALLPIDIYNSIKGVNIDGDIITIEQKYFSDKHQFNVLEPVSPPELVPCPKSLKDINENSTIVLKHHWSGKRYNRLEEEFVFLPPKVEFNIAKYLGTFSLNDKAFFEDVYPWLKKLDGKVPTVWRGNSRSKMKYTFDNRVLGNNLIIELFAIVYNEQNELSDKLVSSLVVKNKWSGMNDAKATNLIINSVPPYYETLGDSFLTKNKDETEVKLRVPEGKKFKLLFKYERGNENPYGKAIIINAVSKLLPYDGEQIIGFDNNTGAQIVRNMNFIELNIKINKVNFNIADYYYLLKRYRKVCPSDWSELPNLKYTIKNRDNHDIIDDELIDKETDVTVSQYTKASSKDDIYDSFSYVEDHVELNLLDKNSILKNKNVIFNIRNVFELEELFSEIKVDFLKSNDPEKKKLAIDNKIGFGRINGIGPYTIDHEYYENDDKRAKNIDYINFKIYSKHLNHFKEHNEDHSLKKLDYNLSRVFSNNKSNDKSFIHDNFKTTNNTDSEIIDEITAPKFDLDLLFFDDIDEDKNSKNKTRKSMLLITFDKNELNRLSDNDYFGIDLSKEENVKVGRTDLETRRTDLGVDFTIDNFEASPLEFDMFKVPIDLIKDSNKKQKLVFNFDGIREVKEYDKGVGNKIVFTKPLYLYNENKGFILLDVSKMLNNSENSLDPFLKISLCQGYSTNYGFTDGRTIWRRTKSSESKYIQLSSKRSVKIKREIDSIYISVKGSIKNKNRTSHFIAFYPKGRKSFKEAIALSTNDAKLNQSYFILSHDTIDSNFSNLVKKEKNTFKISNQDNLVKVKTSGINFNINNYDIKLFEFNYYNNVDAKELSLSISKKGFNPFNDSYFKLIFSA